MPISEVQRPFLTEKRAIEVDSEGREKLVGLSYEDSEWYLGFFADH